VWQAVSCEVGRRRVQGQALWVGGLDGGSWLHRLTAGSEEIARLARCLTRGKEAEGGLFVRLLTFKEENENDPQQGSGKA
jgi:hypothetical protein